MAFSIAPDFDSVTQFTKGATDTSDNPKASSSEDILILPFTKPTPYVGILTITLHDKHVGQAVVAPEPPIPQRVSTETADPDGEATREVEDEVDPRDSDAESAVDDDGSDAEGAIDDNGSDGDVEFYDAMSTTSSHPEAEADPPSSPMITDTVVDMTDLPMTDVYELASGVETDPSDETADVVGSTSSPDEPNPTDSMPNESNPLPSPPTPDQPIDNDHASILSNNVSPMVARRVNRFGLSWPDDQTVEVGEHRHGKDASHLSIDNMMFSKPTPIPVPTAADEGDYIGCLPAVRPEGSGKEKRQDPYHAAAIRNEAIDETEDNTEAVSNGRPSVKISCFERDVHDYRSYIQIEIGLEWTHTHSARDLRDMYVSHIQLRFDARNLAYAPYIICADAEDPRPGPFHRLDANAVKPTWTEQGSVFYLVLHYVPGEIYATGALSTSSFGPHDPLVNRLRRFVAHGGVFHILCAPASGLAAQVAAVASRMHGEIVKPPMSLMWTLCGRQDKYIKCLSENLLSPASAPWRNRKPVVAIADRWELLTALMGGLVHHHQWTQARAATFNRCTAHLVKLDNWNKCIAIAFINVRAVREDPWEDGEMVYLDFPTLNPTGDASYIYRAELRVTDQLRLPAPYGQMFLVRDLPHGYQLPSNSRPFSALGTLPSILGVKDHGHLEDIMKLAPSTLVKVIRMEPNDRAYVRAKMTVNALANLISFEREHDPRKISVTDTLLRANRFDTLPHIDMLNDLDEAELTQLTADCQQPLDHFRSAPAGLALISGPPGAGKTTLLGHLLATLVKNRRCNGDKPLCSLITTPSNAHGDALVSLLGERLRRTVKDAIVVRHYSKQTHRKTIEDGIDEAAGRLTLMAPKILEEIARDPNLDIQTLGRMFLLELIGQEKTTVVDDRRVTLTLMHSAPVYVAIGTGLAEPDPNHHTQPVVDRLRGMFPPALKLKLRECIQHRDIAVQNAMHDDENDTTQDATDASARNALGDVLVEVYKIFYANLDVVVATNQQAQDHAMTAFIRPYLYACDEAGKTDAIDSLTFFRYQDCPRRILLGDVRQAQPQCRSPVTVNGMANQQTFALFSRLISAGFPCLQLLVQHRYVPQICELISGTFYRGMLTSGPAITQCAEGLLVRQCFGRVFHCESNVVLVDVRKSIEERHHATQSKMNPATATVTFDIVKRLHKELRNIKIGILTPYTAQYNRYTTAVGMDLVDRRRRNPAAVSPVAMLETFERAIGSQTGVIVVDLVSADKVGFLNEATRVNTALSRGRYGMVIVADVDSLMKPRKGMPAPILKSTIGHLLNELCRRELKVKYRTPSAPMPTVPNDNPMFEGAVGSEEQEPATNGWEVDQTEKEKPQTEKVETAGEQPNETGWECKGVDGGNW